MKAVAKGNNMIKIADPFWDPPFGGSCGSFFGAQCAFLGLWAAAGGDPMMMILNH